MIQKIVIGLGLLVATSYPLAKKPDSKDTSNEGVVYSAKNWQGIYSAYRRFGRKADGVVAGAFSDRIVTLLDKNWDSVSTLQHLSEKDSRFRIFVLGFLGGETVPYESAERIKEHAATRCPQNAKEFCRDISTALSTE